MCLTPSLYKIFPRHRWIGWQLICDLLQAHICCREEAQLEATAQEFFDTVVLSNHIGEYLKLTNETRFFDPSPQWQQLPQSGWKMALQCVAFRMLSRVGAMVHRHLVLPTTVAPLLLLKTLVQDSALEEVRASRRCLQDSFTADFLSRYPDSALQGGVTAVLSLLHDSVSTETVAIEWTHGRMARLVNVQKVQTCPIDRVSQQPAPWVEALAPKDEAPVFIGEAGATS